MSSSAYGPFRPARRPGSRPSARPKYRVLVHRRFLARWSSIADRVGVENAQQFWDHVASAPGQPPAVGSAAILHGKLGQPFESGFSRTVHYEITGAGRIDYQFNDRYKTGSGTDEHRVVVVLRIELGSH